MWNGVCWWGWGWGRNGSGEEVVKCLFGWLVGGAADNDDFWGSDFSLLVGGNVMFGL